MGRRAGKRGKKDVTGVYCVITGAYTLRVGRRAGKKDVTGVYCAITGAYCSVSPRFAWKKMGIFFYRDGTVPKKLIGLTLFIPVPDTVDLQCSEPVKTPDEQYTTT